MGYKTEQEEFWNGKFGDEYTTRNYTDKIVAGNINLFSKIFVNTSGINSLLEFGANIGQNLAAIKQLLPDVNLTAVEINKSACETLSRYSWIKTINQSVIDFKSNDKFDFVLTKGLLIHINPDELMNFYQVIYESSIKYICLVEYYNPKPVEIPYRGFTNKLFKRDFAGELMDKYPDLKLVTYGFSYHRDNNFPQDDLNWFLMEKS